MYDRVLYDRIVDGAPIPNGMTDDRVIQLYPKGDWLRYSFLYDLPKFRADQIALTHKSSSGVYPICIREPAALNSYLINTLLLNLGERTLSLVKNNSIKLCWFVEKEPPKSVGQIADICKCMADWGIECYSIFTTLPFSVVRKFPEFTNHYPSTEHEKNIIDGDLSQLNAVAERIQSSKRFNTLLYTDNIYDWRLFSLNLLKHAKVLDNSIFSFMDSASMINTSSIDSQSVKNHLAKHERVIRSDLASCSYQYVNFDDVYLNSSFSIVIEAYLNYNTVVDYTFITEKTMRPIMRAQPFVIYGQPRSLPYLHERGYRTFHPYIDESYDGIENDLLRLKTLTAEIARINALTDEEFETLISNLSPIVEHNRAVAHKNIETYYTRIFESYKTDTTS